MPAQACKYAAMTPDDSIQSKGGKARAKALSSEQRSEIARNAALARYDKDSEPIPKATHEGVLPIFDISCAVIDGRQRVLTQSDVMRALGRARQAKGRGFYDADVNLPAFLTAKNLKPFIDNDLYVTSSQIIFRTLKGTKAFGYPAELLPKICEVFLRARDAGKLSHNQKHIAVQADILIRALASVGIIALVDEATGFQYDRPRRDLEEQLKKFLSENLRKWVRTFPADYFKHLCRLRGVELRHDMKLPQYFGQLTNNLIYRRLAPGLLRKLKERREERGSKSNKLHSWLSEDIGLRDVLVHLGQVVAIMKLHTDYEKFERQLDMVVPIYADQPGLFDNPKDWEEPE
ncbi:MAG TPA: P63C domain-containing protein [Chthoniobacterales bacterium]|nr:P63C domain-containing protein [Chthoniobacterales bacterium]